MELPHLERAVELLREAGHPRIAEALNAEAQALVAKAERLEAVLYPRRSAEDVQSTASAEISV